MLLCCKLRFGVFFCSLAFTSAYATDCKNLSVKGIYPRILNKKLLQNTLLLCSGSYSVLYSGIARDPLWVAERLSRTDFKYGAHKRLKLSFYMDNRVSYRDQASLSDYKHSGFDRGHMAPAGDATSDTDQQKTFSVTNVVPQTKELNEGVWTGVEMAVRKLARSYKLIYVVTGPQFSSKIRTIGHNHVFVPFATWKAVYAPSEHASGAYICINNSAPHCKIISIKTLIHFTDIDPFPAIPNNDKHTMLPLPHPFQSPYFHKRF